MEKLNILDVLLTYKNDSDKIAILGKAIEMIIDYTDHIGETFKNVNGNIQQLAKAIMVLDEQVKQINNDLSNLQQFIISNISKLEDTVTTSVSRLEDTVKESTQQGTPTIPARDTVTIAASTPVQRTSVVEESLMKPSQIGKSLANSPGPSPLGGGMSIRSAMMAEIKQRLRTTTGESGNVSAEANTARPKASEVGGGYIPKIHQPREAKKLEGGLVSKMNKLLDSKFQKMAPAIGKSPSGPPSAMVPPSSTPAGPPRAPPSIRTHVPPSVSLNYKSTTLPASPFSGPSPKKKDKKKEKKKKKKKENKQPVTKLSDLEKKIREKLG
ncbi:MAG: hypothetical protein ACTSQI_08900 [Candidatus Helarchaeota archaeon]